MTGRTPSREASARGGRNRSGEKLQALARLHQWRRGRRQYMPLPEAVVEAVASLRATQEVSLRLLAEEAGISDRTLRRWLSREDHPIPAHLLSLRLAIRRLESCEYRKSL